MIQSFLQTFYNKNNPAKKKYYLFLWLAKKTDNVNCMCQGDQIKLKVCVTHKLFMEDCKKNKKSALSSNSFLMLNINISFS